LVLTALTTGFLPNEHTQPPIELHVTLVAWLSQRHARYTDAKVYHVDRPDSDVISMNSSQLFEDGIIIEISNVDDSRWAPE
jgi:hypothetical protein